MTTVIEFTMDAAAFPLGVVFERLPDARITLERVVPTHDDLVPYLWIQAADPASVEQSLLSAPEVESVGFVDAVDEKYLLRVRWADDGSDLLALLATMDVTLLSGCGTVEGWVFSIRAADHETVSAFQNRCTDLSVPITVTAVQTLSSTESVGGWGLTEPQREALECAYEHGYFDEPRRTSLEELAAKLNISRQALSTRLRRAYRRLAEQVIVST